MKVFWIAVTALFGGIVLGWEFFARTRGIALNAHFFWFGVISWAVSIALAGFWDEIIANASPLIDKLMFWRKPQ